MTLFLQNALELSVPATDIVLKNRKNNWVQLSGHEGTYVNTNLRFVFIQITCKIKILKTY